MVKLAAVLLVSSFCAGALASPVGQRTLTFDDRVRAQEAIERVDGRHRIGAEETASLEAYWKISLTDEMLECELTRMARETRPPERLLGLYAALGNDPFLIKECLARPSLVEHMSRDLFAFDPVLHAKAWAEAAELRRRLATGELSPLADYPGRYVFELRRRALLDAVLQVSALEEEHDGFVLNVVLYETPREVRVARYVVPKTTWEAWWATARTTLHSQPIAAVARGRGALPLPVAGPQGNIIFSGTIDSASDLDLFSFCAAAGAAIVLNVDGDPGRDLTPFHPSVLVLDETRVQLAMSGAGWVAPYTGNYFAGVFGDATPTWGDYLLSIGVGGRTGAQEMVDLSVTTSADPEPVEAGGLLTYTIVMTNAGPGTALDANILDPLPVGTTYESIAWSGTQGSWDCTAPAVGTNGKVSCTNKCFAPDDSVTFTITVKVDPCAGGTKLKNTATASSLTPESSPADNAATASTTVIGLGTCADGNICTVGDRCAPGPGFTEDFDGVAAPAIPDGWTATLVTGPVGASTWRTNALNFDTAPNSVFTAAAPDIRDSVLDSPDIHIVSSTAQLSFRNRYDLEQDFDGGVLEIEIGAGPFEDILAAGGSFAAGEYTGTISKSFGSPLGGRQAWTGIANQFVPTTVNLPAAAAGQTIVLRWRMATDQSLGRVGQWIDSVSVGGRNICQPGTPVVCDDNDACTADACDSVIGCGHVSISCEDGNACTDDACDPILGCFHTNKATACDDFNECTRTDACVAGGCVGSNPMVCHDADICTADACDPAIGCVAPTANFDATGFSAARVDGRDLAVLAGSWNSCPGDARYRLAANLDRQEPCIDPSDFHLFMSAFGRTCAP